METSRVILVATSNPGKVREVLAVIHVPGVTFKPLSEFPPMPEPVEDGSTFAANAALKARHYSRLTGLWTLADDSGLEVDALGGAPGVLSARYAGEPADDAANSTKLLSALVDVPAENRTARFRCALALADGEHILATAEGAIEGHILDRPRGSNGFGYDPHFLVPELGLTTAELLPAEKNRRSHRGKALRCIAPRIAALMAGD